MPSLTRPIRSLLLVASSTALLAASPVDLVLEVDSVSLARSGPQNALGFVAGRAFAQVGEAPRFDVVFALDVSGSTGESSGADIDGDGRVSGGFGLKQLFGGKSENPDSVLAAEVQAVRNLLDTFDPRTTRVGLVAFAGGDPGQNHAWVEVGLTSDYKEVRRGLEDVLFNGADGGTNMYEGLKVSGQSLMRGRLVAGSKGRQKHMVLLTDGYPTLPSRGGFSSREPTERAIIAARVLGKRGVRIHTFAIGRDAVSRPRAAVEVAKASGGKFTAVADPADLGRLLGEVQFASIESLRVRNLTTNQASLELVHNADGGFGALLPISPGANRIEVIARSTDGTERRVVVTKHVGEGSLSMRQEADRARLLAASQVRQKSRGSKTRELEIDVEPPSR